ncbi:MAG: hypothetical protein LUE20_08980 [Oscillospiraceae bacterium]|nr:hypothetical protein [Oscillospiraceae bacterium]
MATSNKQTVEFKGCDLNEGTFRVLNPANVDRIGRLETDTVRELLLWTQDVLYGLCYEEYIVPEELYYQASKYLRYIYKLLIFRNKKLAALREVQVEQDFLSEHTLARKLSDNEEAELFTYFINLEKDFKQLPEWISAPILDCEDEAFVGKLSGQHGYFPILSQYLLHTSLHDPTIGLE